jgi:dTDP-4-dehydrorhamnose reductase
MRILITGSAGMLGHDVLAAARAGGHETVALTRAELDITQAAAVAAAVGGVRPDVVVNCAAWTNVDDAQEAVDAAHAVNGAGAGNVARAAAAAGAWTVHVSSDYVFDGTKTEPYVESDPVAPQSVYGASKLEGERAVASAAPGRHTIVRSSWLFGTEGPCFPATIMRLAAEREQLSVVADQVGCPTFTGDLAPALVDLAAGAADPPAGILHVAGGGQCSWFEFAQEIVVAAGLDCEVVPVTTAEFPRPAPRPAYSVLRSERGSQAPALPGWRAGLARYLAARNAGGVGTPAATTVGERTAAA